MEAVSLIINAMNIGAKLNAIFGPGGNYVYLADGTALDITTLTP